MYKYTLIFTAFFISVLVSGQASEQTVIAKPGDGIYKLLQRYNINPVKYLNDFKALNKSKLTSKEGLIAGKSYVLPIVSDSLEVASEADKKAISFPLFGKEHSPVEVESDLLESTVYYLVSGHGGPDPGATTTYNGTLISEDEYAYDVTLRLAKKLMANGAEVHLIIKDDNDGIRDNRILKVDYDEVNHPSKKIPRSQRLRLQQRTKTVNSLYIKNKGKYQRLIVTHVDSRNEGKNVDVFFYHHKNSKNGKRLANSIHNAFKEKYAKHQPNRSYSGTVSERSKLYMIRNTLPAMTYIELGNIKNSKDQKRILSYQNREALANWIYSGILKDFEERN
jgi:N-acetylmuramoyl-L-alanine amidase